MDEDYYLGKIEALTDGYMRLLDFGFDHPVGSTLDLFTRSLYREIEDTIAKQDTIGQQSLVIGRIAGYKVILSRIDHFRRLHDLPLILTDT